MREANRATKATGEEISGKRKADGGNYDVWFVVKVRHK